MADNVTVTSGNSGTFDFAADEISSVKYQRAKLIHGADGTNDGDVANTNGLPVKSSYTTATLQNAVSATGNGTSLSVLGMATAALTISGIYVGTVSFEGTENGSVWDPITAIQLATGALVTVAPNGATNTFVMPCAALQSIRARVTWTSGTSVTVTGHAVAGTWDGAAKNIAQLAGNTIDTNSGVKSAGTMRVVLATDQPALTNALKADATIGGTAVDGNSGNKSAQTLRVVIATDQPSLTNPLSVSNTASATGGVTPINSTSSDGGTALTSTAQVIKASAGTLQGWYIFNPNVAAQYVQFYNTAAASVTVGTTNPLFMLTIPAGSAANLSLTAGIAFGTAMSWSATSTAGGNGAPSTALDAVCWYA